MPLPHVPDLAERVTLISDLAPDVRRAVYQTGATLSGTLLGLTLTSISVLNTSLKANLEELSAGHFTAGKQQRSARLFFAAVRALGVALLVMLTLLILDSTEATGATPTAKDDGSMLGQALALSVVLLCVLRIMRVIWVLGRVLNLSAAPAVPAESPVVPISDAEY